MTEVVFPYKFPDLPKPKIFGRRVKDFVEGTVVKPVSYDVRFLEVPKAGIYEDYGIKLSEDSRAYQLYVAAYQELILNRGRMTPLVRMNLIKHGDNSWNLFGGRFSCMVPIRNVMYDLDYGVYLKEADNAVIQKATRLTHYAAGLYTEDRVLKEEEYKQMHFENKGFPPIVDWLSTAKMYAYGQIPDENGLITPESPILTADHIYAQPLVPSRLKIEGINV